jgi:hypothetical protein
MDGCIPEEGFPLVSLIQPMKASVQRTKVTVIILPMLRQCIILSFTHICVIRENMFVVLQLRCGIAHRPKGTVLMLFQFVVINNLGILKSQPFIKGQPNEI